MTLFGTAGIASRRTLNPAAHHPGPPAGRYNVPPPHHPPSKPRRAPAASLPASAALLFLPNIWQPGFSAHPCCRYQPKARAQLAPSELHKPNSANFHARVDLSHTRQVWVPSAANTALGFSGTSPGWLCLSLPSAKEAAAQPGEATGGSSLVCFDKELFF